MNIIPFLYIFDYRNGMIFEYDPEKSLSTRMKHGLDFEAAQALWEDANLVEIGAKTVEDEPRSMLIGRIGAKHWSAIVSKRNNKTRIISVRPLFNIRVIRGNFLKK